MFAPLILRLDPVHLEHEPERLELFALLLGAGAFERQRLQGSLLKLTRLLLCFDTAGCRGYEEVCCVSLGQCAQCCWCYSHYGLHLFSFTLPDFKSLMNSAARACARFSDSASSSNTENRYCRCQSPWSLTTTKLLVLLQPRPAFPPRSSAYWMRKVLMMSPSFPPSCTTRPISGSRAASWLRDCNETAQGYHCAQVRRGLSAPA